MLGILQQLPLNRPVVIPLRALPQLAAHESQFLSRMRVQVRIQQPQVRELLPQISGILFSSEPFPCTTSSCDSGSTKFSLNAYSIENVNSP